MHNKGLTFSFYLLFLLFCYNNQIGQLYQSLTKLPITASGSRIECDFTATVSIDAFSSFFTRKIDSFDLEQGIFSLVFLVCKDQTFSSM